jgi:hypothetical protein
MDKNHYEFKSRTHIKDLYSLFKKKQLMLSSHYLIESNVKRIQSCLTTTLA